jgi:hypothetical protein
MGSIPITRSTPRLRQAIRGNERGGEILIAWDKHGNRAPRQAAVHCPVWLHVAPAFAR